MRAFLRSLEGRGLRIADCDGRSQEESARITFETMRKGFQIIYQGTLLVGNQLGRPDFLGRVESRSNLGDFGYEVMDAKLARTEKVRAIIQLCFYSDLLAQVQGVDPLMMHLVLGDGTEKHFRVANYSRYYRNLKSRFFEHLGTDPHASYPERCIRCDDCHWIDVCKARWEEDDHLNQVANITRLQIKKLSSHGIDTLAGLAKIKDGQNVPRMQSETVKKLHQQAALQLSKRESAQDKHLVLDLDASGIRGFYRLPKPNEGDLFFDMEGDPLEPGGHEYLFGVYYLENGTPQYKDFWGCEKFEERRAFENFMDFVMVRLEKYPCMHVYHYANYEEAAIKRLMSIYGTRENQVDHLLRNRVLVDLYKVVREAIMVSEPRYSIKNLETFYMKKREEDVKTAVQSIVYFEEWRNTGNKDKLQQIRDYNQADCRSTYLLLQWLHTLRPPHLPWFDSGKVPVTPLETTSEAEVRLREYEKKLLDGIPKNPDDWTNEERSHELVFHLLEYHRREAKPQWWKMFHWQEMSEPELIEDPDCIGGMECVDKRVLPKPKRSTVYTYRYPPQEFKTLPGDACRADTLEGLKVIQIDESNRLLQVTWANNKPDLPPRLSLTPGKPFDTSVLKNAIYRFADSLIEGDKKYHALKSFLCKDLPSIKGHSAGEPVINPDEPAVTDAVANLQESYLFIQGPPGAGKTYTGSHVIADLIHGGFTVGVSSNSHKAINNLLSSVEKVAKERGLSFKGMKKSDGEEQAFNGKFIEDVDDANEILAGNPDLIAGTAWLFGRPEFDQIVDYLFVDEAGQVSLANLVAMGTSARNIVLLGDQMQLSQPTQGVHPGRSGESALEYLLDQKATVSPDQGVFLEKTWRMHEDVCRFISEAVYDGKLHSEDRNQTQKILLKKDAHVALRPTGICFVKAAHSDCVQSSEEEAAIVLECYNSLMKQTYIDKECAKHPMTTGDILVVSPYNLQVNLLRKTLPEGARIGTIDKFQGQEAPVVIISMATSTGDDLPREIEFLYSKNRLNVAISRAKCLALLIANPNLMAIQCKTVEQIQLVNTLCWLHEYADALAGK